MSMLMAMLLWSSITARGVINPVVVAAPAGGNSALYVVLRNSAGTEDRLVRVTCSCAERIEVLAARDGGLHLEGESVALPPERLVELRPGGTRHLSLLRLRRPLVAGQTVDMIFHYAQGAETRAVRIVADAAAGWTAGLAGTGPHRLAPLEPLAGWCWRGTFSGGRRTDTRCFSPAYGMFMQDRYVSEGGPAHSAGYTSYMHDVMGMSTGFRSRGPDGRQRYGRIAQAEGRLLFLDYPEPVTGRFTTRTSWQRDGADAWIVRSEILRWDGWRERSRLRMVRAGPAPGD